MKSISHPKFSSPQRHFSIWATVANGKIWIVSYILNIMVPQSEGKYYKQHHPDVYGCLSPVREKLPAIVWHFWIFFHVYNIWTKCVGRGQQYFPKLKSGGRKGTLGTDTCFEDSGCYDYLNHLLRWCPFLSWIF